jgi:hypothetical protein
MSVLKLPLLADIQPKVGELVVFFSIASWPLNILQNTLN